MVQRIGYGTLAIVVLGALALADAWVAHMAQQWSGMVGALLRQGNVICVTCLVVFLMGARELDHFFRLKDAKPWSAVAYFVVALLVVAPWFAAARPSVAPGSKIDPWRIQAVILLLGVLGTACAAVLRGRTDGALRDVSATWAIIFYTGFLGSFATALRCEPSWPPGSGIWLMLLIILSTKASDIGGYLVGTALGRHRLIPGVSPGKSVEGTLGGIATSALVMVFAVILAPSPAPAGSALGPAMSLTDGLLSALAFLRATSPTFSLEWSILAAALFGAFLATVAQFGDLIESCFKRDAFVKDSGNIMPRFGGMLDLIDSLLMALPVAWLVLIVVRSISPVVE